MMWVLSIILLLLFIYITIGVFDIRKNLFIKSINSIEKGNICLTFDDGPHTKMTPKILDVLQKHNVKANFFLIGEASEKNQDIVKRIHEEGHIIGCHTFFHKKTFPISSLNEMENELIKTNKLIQSITRNEIKLFRPPFGITNPNIKRVLRKLKMTSVGWDIRSLDTVTSDAKKLSTRIIHKINNGGSIILFHDRCENTLAILEDIIIYCHKQSLKFKTIK